MWLRISHGWRQRACSRLGITLHLGQYLVHCAIKQVGGHRVHALQCRLKRNIFHGCHPQHPLFAQHTDRFPHGPQLSPEQADHEGHHHRQCQGSFTQTQLAKVSDLVQCGWMNGFFQPLFDNFIRWSSTGTFLPVPLNRPGMRERVFSFWLLFCIYTGGGRAEGRRICSEKTDPSASHTLIDCFLMVEI